MTHEWMYIVHCTCAVIYLKVYYLMLRQTVDTHKVVPVREAEKKVLFLVS